MLVVAYELIGTAFLTYSIIAVGGNAVKVSMVALCLMIILNPISAVHLNPAVTLAVFIQRDNKRDNFFFALKIMAGEMVGCMLGAFLTLLDVEIKPDQIP